MSFDDFDTSISSGQSARLYQFDRSATVVWRYTSADRALQFDGHEWLPLPISDDGIRLTGEASADTMKVTLPGSEPVAQLFRGAPPSEEIFLTVRDYDAGAQDADVIWVGSVSSVQWPRQDTAELACDSLAASMSREGLSLSYERACPHSVYDSECRVDKDLYAVDVLVVAMDGSTLQLGTVASVDIYNGGALAWEVDESTEMRGIESATAGGFSLIGGTDGLAVGQAVTIYPGCDGTRVTCNSRFNNLLNQGGFAHMPGKSIYGGERLW